MLRFALTAVFLLVSAGQGQPPATPRDDSGVIEGDRVSTLVGLIADPRQTPEARGYFIRDLLSQGSESSMRAVGDILAGSGDDAVLTTVCQAISELSEPRASLLVPLLNLVERHPGVVRESGVAALSAFHGSESATVVGRFVLDRTRSAGARLAAMEVLGESAESAESVDALIEALDDREVAIRQRARALLVRMGLADQGVQSMAWRAWWVRHRSDSPVPRLRSILDYKTRELRDSQAVRAGLVDQNLELLRRIYDRSTESERIELLTGFLSDREDRVRILGATLIDGMIADRKDVPPEVIEPLRSLVEDPSASVRKRAIPVLRDMRNPIDAPVFLARLEVEADERVLRELINAVGRLAEPGASEQVIRFLGESYPPEVNGEAADSLGLLLGSNRLGRSPETAPSIGQAVSALQVRFETTSGEEEEIRERILRAMANIADPSFGPTFLAQADSLRDGMKSAAIRGLAALGQAEHMPLLLRHLSDTNATVRQIAAEAVGRLGDREEHLEALLPRIDPNVESVEGTRVSAWEAFMRVFGKQLPEVQLRWTNRLDPRTQNPVATPERLAALLLASEKALSGVAEHADRVAEVRLRLAEVFSDMGRHAESVSHYRQAADWLKTQPRSVADARSANMLRAQLSARRIGLAIEHLSVLLAEPSEEAEAAVRPVVAEFAAARLSGGEASAALVLIDELLESTAVGMSEDWRAELVGVREQARRAVAKIRHQRALDLVRRFEEGGADEASLREEILTHGSASVQALLQRLGALLDGSQPDVALEEKLVSLLKELRPDWPGFEPDASDEEKRASLSILAAND